MKKCALAAVAAVSMIAMVAAANAADISPAPSTYDWSGIYIGLNAGAAWSNSEVDGRLECTDTPGGADCTNFDATSDYYRHGVDDSGAVFNGGAMIGANWQHESVVLGVEADVNYADFGANSSRSSVFDPPGSAPPAYIYSNSDLDANWWGTVRGRLGFAADNLLFFGTGGLAWGTVNASARVDICNSADCVGPSLTASGSESDTLIGWTVGGGLEYGLGNWILGAEYLYVDLGNTDFDHRVVYNNQSPPPGIEVNGNADVDYQFSVVRATAKWKF